MNEIDDSTFEGGYDFKCTKSRIEYFILKILNFIMFRQFDNVVLNDNPMVFLVDGISLPSDRIVKMIDLTC
ncbi:hypothetical protein [Inediibacterium massiliense]|uniref:hypothetical protein n=1 Tax=Inediibacterium massiliense TaxID=1658111 RepID=UPI0018FF10F9|nr:hypothetical protein [Inediibacterium massiliense]